MAEAKEGFQVMGLKASDLDPLKSILKSLSTKQVIFVCEKHDDYATHLAQLYIIKGLYEAGANLSVGLEMFQRPFQGVLDDYLSGKIDKKSLLKQSEYFKRWGFDFRFYEPIIDYCKEKGIPIVALNLPSEISKKVARQGIESLGDQERASLPKEIQWNNEPYRKMLKEIFFQHPSRGPARFDYFYQAQILWDETMAESIASYLSQNPNRQMVVIVGSGHVAYGYGIPSRVARRGLEYTTVLCDSEGGISPDKADFYLFPKPVEPPFSAKIGVLLEQKGDHLVVQDVMKGGLAYQGGIKKGDIILAFGKEGAEPVEIKDITDLRLELFFIAPGDRAKIVVKRSLRFRPDRVITLDIGPFGLAERGKGAASSPHKSR